MKSLASARDTAEILHRLTLVRPDSRRLWGRMTAHQMICHLRDAFIMGTAEKPVSHVGGAVRQAVFRWTAVHAPLRWPAGIATRPEVDQLAGGTPPTEFRADMDSLVAVVGRLRSDPEFFRDRRHPIFGRMSVAAWMRWGYRHMDHHLRQFGV